MIYDAPRFLPAGDRFLLVELGNEMNLELNFLAHGLASLIAEHGPQGVVETSPGYATLLVHYEPDDVSFGRLQEEIADLARQIGPSDDVVLDSRLFYFPTAYLDPWSREAVDRYIEKIAEKPRDPDLLVAHNGLVDVDQLVRVHAASEYWVAAIGWWPGVPFMMPLDPRCRLTAPRYNPPRTWTKKGTVGVGGGTTGIYPEDLPGGIQIFARIPVPIWDRAQRFPIFKDSICLLRPGDRVKFVPCTLEEFEAVERKVEDGTYAFNVIEYQRFSVPSYRSWVAAIDADQRF